jgi:transcriptional regulator
MYIPHLFEVTDPAVLHAFMERYSFATLVSPAPGRAPGCGDGAVGNPGAEAELMATHLPLLLDRQRGPHGTLLGHVARANPHWERFDGSTMSLAIFHGPHAYVSPSWYADPAHTVPTWNYAVVHAYGAVTVATDPAFVPRLLARMVQYYESARAEPWITDIASAVNQKMMSAVVGFEIPITRLQGKFKLNQNRDAVDQQRAAAGLASAGDPESAAVARLMREYLGLP